MLDFFVGQVCVFQRMIKKSSVEDFSSRIEVLLWHQKLGGVPYNYYIILYSYKASLFLV